MKYQDRDVPVKELFDCVGGNSGLTEEYLYSTLLQGSQKEYSCLTGSIDVQNTQRTFLCPHPKNRTKNITVYEGEGIHVVRKGKAGHVNYLPHGKYTLNDDAYLITKRKDIDYRLSLKWFAYTQRHLFMEYASKSDNATWNKTSFFEHAKIDIPVEKDQETELNYYEQLQHLKRKLDRVQSTILKIKQKSILVPEIHSEEILLSYIFDYTSRNDCLSEEGLYKRSEGIEDALTTVTVISGSTSGFYGLVPYDDEIHIVQAVPCLQVVTRGKAGQLRFLAKGYYATNTNSMLLTIKQSKKSLLNIHRLEDEEKYLKCMEIFLQPYFTEYCSSADLSVFPLTEAIDKISFPLIIYGKQVNDIVQKFTAVTDYEHRIETLTRRIETILDKKLVD